MDSLIRSRDIKEYCEKHKIEKVINEAVNEVLITLPPDPFAGICSIVKSHSTETFTISQIILKNEFNNDFTKVPTLNISLSFKGNSRNIYSYPIPYSDEDKEKMATGEIIEDFSNLFKKPLEGYSFDNIEDFDMYLNSINSVIPTEKRKYSRIIINALSISMLISMSRMYDMTLPLFFKEKFPDNIGKLKSIPGLGFSIFKTGKTMNSKVKFERFMILINNQNKMDKNALIDIVNKIYAALRKVLTAGKAGENGMRLNNEGSFYPPSDNLNDILKLLEGVINEVNVPDVLKIGIDCNANNYYVGADKTYEMDGFKKNPDSNQLIDFYLKLLSDHPLIEYMEEPFYKDDEEGLYKFMAKVRAEHPKLMVVSKVNLANFDLDNNAIPTEPAGQFRGELCLTTPDEEKEKRLKTDQPKKPEDEDDSSKANYVSFRMGNISNYSDIAKVVTNFNADSEEDNIEYGIVLYDFDNETKQSCITEIGMAIKAKFVILNGLTMREEKLIKIKEYIELIQDFY